MSEVSKYILKEWGLFGQAWWNHHYREWIEPVLGKGVNLDTFKLEEAETFLTRANKVQFATISSHSLAAHFNLPIIGLYEAIDAVKEKIKDEQQFILPGRDAWPFYVIAKRDPFLGNRVIYLPSFNGTTASYPDETSKPHIKAILEEAKVRQGDLFLDSGFRGSVFLGLADVMGWKKVQGFLFQSSADFPNITGRAMNPDGYMIESYAKYQERAEIMVELKEGQQNITPIPAGKRIFTKGQLVTLVRKNWNLPADHSSCIERKWIEQPLSKLDVFKIAARLSFYCFKKKWVCRNQSDSQVNLHHQITLPYAA